MTLGLCRFTNADGGTVDWTYSGPTIDMQSPASAGAVNGAVYQYYAQSTDMEQWEIGTGAYTESTGVFARTTVLFNSNGDTSLISFLNPPQVIVFDGPGAAADGNIRYDQVQSLTVDEQAQARANIGVAADDSTIKAWGYLIGNTGTLSIAASFNVASVSRLSAGVYVVNLTKAFASINYAVTFGINRAAGPNSIVENISLRTVSSFQVTAQSGTTATDGDFSFMAAGRQ